MYYDIVRYQQFDAGPKLWDFGPTRRNGQKEAIAIHHDYHRRVLIFCQIREFQSYNPNKKSNKSI